MCDYSLVSLSMCAQQNQKIDSTQTQNLEEVLVKAVRVEANSPITHSNVTKAQIRTPKFRTGHPHFIKLFAFGSDSQVMPVLVLDTQELEFEGSVQSTKLRLMEFHITMQNP